MTLEDKKEKLQKLTVEYDSILCMPDAEFLKPEITKRLKALHEEMLILAKEIIRSAKRPL